MRIRLHTTDLYNYELSSSARIPCIGERIMIKSRRYVIKNVTTEYEYCDEEKLGFISEIRIHAENLQ